MAKHMGNRKVLERGEVFTAFLLTGTTVLTGQSTTVGAMLMLIGISSMLILHGYCVVRNWEFLGSGKVLSQRGFYNFHTVTHPFDVESPRKK